MHPLGPWWLPIPVGIILAAFLIWAYLRPWLRSFWAGFRSAYLVAKDAGERGAGFDTARRLGKRAGERDP